MKESKQQLGEFAHLLPRGWSDIVTLWFQEDTPSLDFGGFVVGETEETATLFGKSQVQPVRTIIYRLGCLGWGPFLQ